MGWLTSLFTGKDSAKEHARKQSQKVRAREKELRRGKDARKTSFFWGSPGQTYESNVRGPGEGV